MTATVFMYFGVILKEYQTFVGYQERLVFPAALTLWINEVIFGNPYLSIVKNCYPNGAFDFIGGGAEQYV